MFVGLNPSTADEKNDDPTVRRCINYAKDWGFSGMFMMNIFAFRATDPRVMKAEPEPIGEENDHYLNLVAKNAGVIVAAWGVHGAHNDRGNQVKAMLGEKLQCLRLTKDGYPAHPLYLPKNLRPVEFNKFQDGVEALSK